MPIRCHSLQFVLYFCYGSKVIIAERIHKMRLLERIRMNSASVVDNRYQYNGKELNEDFGLNWNDYGARFYDATLGRWNAVDPMADGYAKWSPYCYVLNNPLSFIDPDGQFVIRADNSPHGREEAKQLKAMIKIMTREMKSWNNAQWGNLLTVTGMSKKAFKNMFKDGQGPEIRFQTKDEIEFFLRTPQAYAATNPETGNIVFGHVMSRIMRDYNLLKKGEISNSFTKSGNRTVSDANYIRSEMAFVERFMIGVFGHELGHSAHKLSGRTAMFGDSTGDRSENDFTERGFNFERSVIGRILPHNTQSLGNGVIQSYNYYILISGPGSRTDNEKKEKDNEDKTPPRV
jgi:RHS repeat-associated protein